MEEMQWTRYGETVWSAPYPLQMHHAPRIIMCPLIWKLSKPSPLGFYMEASSVKTDEIIGHWQMIQPPAPLPSPEAGQWN